MYKKKKQQQLNPEIEAFFLENFKFFVVFAEAFVYDRYIAEDIVQDVFLNFIEKEIEITTSLKAYFYQSVKSRCLNHLRDKNVYDKHKILFIEAFIASQDADSYTDEDQNKAVRQAIEELPGEMSKVFELRYMKEKNYLEVAQALNISTNTVATQLARGKKKLKAVLKDLSNLNFTFFW